MLAISPPLRYNIDQAVKEFCKSEIVRRICLEAIRNDIEQSELYSQILR